jgi:SAM-dependent methyltransferase
MAAQEAHAPVGGTTSEDYSDCYYTAAHLGGYDDYRWENPQWQQLFTHVADRIIALANPRKTLDVGCAKGLLVQALAARGVDAQGVDVSTHAIATAHEDVRDRLRVASATEPIDGRYDLITCIEVLEHMSPADAQAAIDNMCDASERVLFSSSPGDFDEPTHVNTQPTAAWAAWFAERGFFRRTDVNLEFLSAWAVLFERADVDTRSLVHRYETLVAPLQLQVHEKTTALLSAHRAMSELHDQINELESGIDGPIQEEMAALREELVQAHHDKLTIRDHIIGLEAEAERLTVELRVSRNRVAHLLNRLANQKKVLQRQRKNTRQQRRQVEDMRKRLAAQRARADARTRELADAHASRSWRLGRALTRPFAAFR